MVVHFRTLQESQNYQYIDVLGKARCKWHGWELYINQ